MAFILPNTVETAVVLLGAMTAGIVNPINPLLEPEQISAILRETKAKVVVTLRAFPLPDRAVGVSLLDVTEAVAAVPAAGLLIAFGVISWHDAAAEVSRLLPVVGFLAAVLVLYLKSACQSCFSVFGSSEVRPSCM